MIKTFWILNFCLIVSDFDIRISDFMIILAIDTSLDETSVAVLDGERVLSSIVWSQLKLHQKWGGVVPHLARRAHEERLPSVVKEALVRARISEKSAKSADLADTPIFPKIEALAVTIGPGVAPALEVGIAYAKKLALLNNLPLIPVNHLEGHIASLFLKTRTGRFYVNGIETMKPPYLSLIVSGGHTELVETRARKKDKGKRIKEKGQTRSQSSAFGLTPSTLFPLPSSFFLESRLLGASLDDAAGECLDKVGRELGLGYPAGPVIEQLAKTGNPHKIQFPIPLLRSPRSDLNFSFSGLKTAAVQLIHRAHNIPSFSQRRASEVMMSSQEVSHFCASFQLAIFESLVLKLRRAMAQTGIKRVLFTGGVAANNYLRRRLGAAVRREGGVMYAASKRFTGDNAAMIALAAGWAYQRGEVKASPADIQSIDRLPNLNFAD